MGDYEQYRNTAWTIDRTMCVIDLLREQNKHRAGLLMPKIVTSLQEICTMLSERGEAQVQLLLRMAGALQEYLQAQEYGDDLLCADLLEGRILPLLYEIQSQVPQDVAEKVQAQRSAGLAIELTASGFYTLRYQPKQGHGFYLHGNTNPM
nr:hypothetical protein [Lachnospiraceae bacterium]